MYKFGYDLRPARIVGEESRLVVKIANMADTKSLTLSDNVAVSFCCFSRDVWIAIQARESERLLYPAPK
jgi:hypothetical protein